MNLADEDIECLILGDGDNPKLIKEFESNKLSEFFFDINQQIMYE